MDDFAIHPDATTVQFVRLLPGPIERVWSYLWDSDKRAQWFAGGAMPAKPGESFTLHFKHSTLSPHQSPPPPKYERTDREGRTATHVLLAAEPPHRLVFSFGPDANADPHVEILLEPEGDKVRLTLNHTRVPNRQYAIDVSGGWHSHLAVLEYRLKGETPPAFWDIWRQTEGVYEKRYGEA